MPEGFDLTETFLDITRRASEKEMEHYFKQVAPQINWQEARMIFWRSLLIPVPSSSLLT
jgi:hypothetical protein